MLASIIHGTAELQADVISHQPQPVSPVGLSHNPFRLDQKLPQFGKLVHYA